MNRLLLSFFTVLMALPAVAQLGADGYYRVKNFRSGRYILMIDNKSTGFNAAATTYDLDALMTLKPYSELIADPGSVIYIEKKGTDQYNLKAQGTDAYASVGRYLTISVGSASQQTYFASATESGIKLFLYDEQYTGTEGRLSTESTVGGSNDLYRHWLIQPISASNDDNYVGIEPSVTVGGQSYAAFFASFPFTFASTGMKAYQVTKVDADLAVWQELSGTVAASEPVIVACAGATVAANRLNLELTDGQRSSANQLQGVYFNNSAVSHINGDESNYHFNAIANDATIRLLGVTAEGRLGFVRNTSVKYIPRNSAYLKVAAGAPDEITLVTQDEYDAIVAADVVTVTARSYSRVYGEANPVFEYDVEGPIKGEPVLTCAATPDSPAGEYPIVVARGTVSNRTFHAVNGTLTITVPDAITAPTVQGGRSGSSTVQGGRSGSSTVQGGYPALSFPADVYALDGRLLRRQATTLDGLPAGLYIVDGRKVVVR